MYVLFFLLEGGWGVRCVRQRTPFLHLGDQRIGGIYSAKRIYISSLEAVDLLLQIHSH